MSLRDVERAMIVFEYMYKMMDVFGPLMDKWAAKEQARSEENSGTAKVRHSAKLILTIIIMHATAVIFHSTIIVGGVNKKLCCHSLFVGYTCMACRLPAKFLVCSVAL